MRARIMGSTNSAIGSVAEGQLSPLSGSRAESPQSAGGEPNCETECMAAIANPLIVLNDGFVGVLYLHLSCDSVRPPADKSLAGSAGAGARLSCSAFGPLCAGSTDVSLSSR